MSYEQKFIKVKNSLINDIKEQISSRYHYCNEFQMWSYSDIKESYIVEFKKEFEQYMNSDIESTLWFAGQNLSFAVKTFINLNPGYTHNKLLKFVVEFVTVQLDDFDNWCEEIGISMYEEKQREENST